jgi:hypothetical protein
MGINERRIVDFLLSEHLRQGCRRNGLIEAPWRQLCAFGVGRSLISVTLVALEAAGLVMCARPGLGKRSHYRLSWLPTHDGRPATNEWRSQNGAPKPVHKDEPVTSRNRFIFTGAVFAPKPVHKDERHTLIEKKGPSDRDSLAVPQPCPPSTPLSDGNTFSDRLGSDPARAGGNGTAVVGKLPWSKPTYVEIALKPWAGAE